MDGAERRRLWLLQLRLECKGLDPDGRMVRTPGEDPDPIPVCAVTRFGDGEDQWAFDRSVAGQLLHDLQQVRADDLFTGAQATDALAHAHDLQRQVCRTYRFTQPDSTVPPGVVRRNGPEEFAALANGHEVAWASSSRSDDQCAELWIYTDPDQRGRGYAQQAALAWAADVRASGRVAFYSHLADNHPSERLAARLGVRHLFDIASLAAPDEPPHRRHNPDDQQHRYR